MKNTTKAEAKHIAKLSSGQIQSWLMMGNIPLQTRMLMVQELRERRLRELID